MDGQGGRGAKLRHLAGGARRPAGTSLGWKNFYDEDHPTFTPEQTAAVEPYAGVHLISVITAYQ